MAEAIDSNNTGKRAVILLGHGSRASGVVEDMGKIVESLKQRLDFDMVEMCQMSGLGELFPEVFDKCVAAGATRVVVAPYFLHFGIHLREDVPRMLLEKAEQYPDVTIVFGKHLGYDDALVDLLKKRIEESRELPDVRQAGYHLDNT